jgi:hypothetical protein
MAFHVEALWNDPVAQGRGGGCGISQLGLLGQRYWFKILGKRRTGK